MNRPTSDELICYALLVSERPEVGSRSSLEFVGDITGWTPDLVQTRLAEAEDRGIIKCLKDFDGGSPKIVDAKLIPAPGRNLALMSQSRVQQYLENTRKTEDG